MFLLFIYNYKILKKLKSMKETLSVQITNNSLRALRPLREKYQKNPFELMT